MLFRQKVLVAFVLFCYISAIISIIIGVVGLLLIGFNLFTICFTIGGLACIALIFLIIFRMKNKTNNSMYHMGIFDKDGSKKLLRTFRNRPALFRFKATLVYYGVHIYLAGLFVIWVALSVIALWLGSILDSFGAALGFGLIITWVIFICAKPTVRMLFTSPSYDGVYVTKENCPELFRLLNRASALTKTSDIDAVVLSDDYACNIYRIRKRLHPPKTIAHLDTRLVFFLDEAGLFAVVVNTMLIAERKKGKLADKLDRRFVQWIAYCNTVLSKRRKWPLGFFGNKYYFALMRYITIVSKTETLIADKDSSILLGSKIVSEALIKQAFVSEEFRLSCYDLPLKLFNASEHPDNLYIWLRERILEQTGGIPKTWLSQIEDFDAENDSQVFLTVAERLSNLNTDIKDLNTSFSSMDYPSYLDTLSTLIRESATREIDHGWYEQHECWKKTYEAANAEVDGDIQLISKIDALIALDEIDIAEVLLNSLCEPPEPKSAALLRRGKMRLDKNDITGVDDLIRVIELEADEFGYAADRMQEYRNEHPDLFNDEQGALLENAQKRFARQQAEMNHIGTEDVFMPIAAEFDLKMRIAEKTREMAGVEKVFLVRKVMAHATFDFYILAVAHGQFVSSEVITSNIWNMQLELIENGLRLATVDLNSNPAFWKPIALVSGSLIYEKEGDCRG